MKTRVLFCGEFSQLSTGYAVYAKEVIRRLYKNKNLDIREYASYIEPNDSSLSRVPWKVYSAIPQKGTKLRDNYNPQHGSHQFGSLVFESVCLDFKPHIVLDIRDFWMVEHEISSPYRKYFYHILMPTVDSYPQNEQWVNAYSKTDGVFTYQDWSYSVLKKYNNINLLGSASPAADESFYPYDNFSRNELKKSLGLNNKFVIGSVMRNQRRKLFPDLFNAFRMLLDNNKDRNDLVLYCHTSYPDMGWDIPRYLNEYDLLSKVIFTYKCQNCGNIEVKHFSDAVTVCSKCNKLALSTVGVQNGIDNNSLRDIYNIFDVYIQYSNSEGFGMPQVEAAACGVPVVSTNFSAMKDILKKVKGEKVNLLHEQWEVETGCKRAIPDNKNLCKVLQKFIDFNREELDKKRFDTKIAYDKNYGWDKTADKWLKAISNVDINKYESLWNSKINLVSPSKYSEETNKLSNFDYARWLIKNVLMDESYINSYMETRLIRDLNYGQTIVGVGGSYFNELSGLSERPVFEKFDRIKAYEMFYGMREKINFWEDKRMKSNV